jgi:hypothetical protein
MNPNLTAALAHARITEMRRTATSRRVRRVAR